MAFTRVTIRICSFHTIPPYICGLSSRNSLFHAELSVTPLNFIKSQNTKAIADTLDHHEPILVIIVFLIL